MSRIACRMCAARHVLIVRMAIAPAVVTLLGDGAWWLPAWLDRALPNVSLEGDRETIERQPEREEAPTDDAPESPPAAIPVTS